MASPDCQQQEEEQVEGEENKEEEEEEKEPIERPQPVAVIDAIAPPQQAPDSSSEVDATLAHREYLEGRLPNVFSEAKELCMLKDRDHGRLLSRVKLRVSGSTHHPASLVYCPLT